MEAYFQSNPETLWFSLGFLLLAIEAIVLGLSTGVVLFAGFGAIITGGLIWIGWLPHGLQWGIASFGISSSLITLLLWRPLRALQAQGADPQRDSSSDLIGHRFRLQQTISVTEPGETHYSGISWRVEIDADSPEQQIEAGTLVSVKSVGAGRFGVGR